MNSMTLKEFHAACDAQSPEGHEWLVFKCPACKTLQTPVELMQASGLTYDEIQGYIGFSCVGRLMHSPKEPGGKLCKWTLGGFLQIHTFEVIDEDGNHHPLFELATKEEADAHRALVKGVDHA